MAAFTKQEDMALASRLRTTDTPHQTFDVTQFRKLVEEDVPEKVIGDLQAEFGEDMAGAIDKFLENKKKTSEESTKEGEAKKDVETKDQDADAPADPLGRKEIVIRDRYWNRSKRRYVLEKPSKSRVESKKDRKCVIFVRRDYNAEMTNFTTALVISGSVLRNALMNIFRGADGFGLTDNESTEITPEFMYWARPELQMLADHYDSVGDKKGLFEIKSALNFIGSEYEDMIPVLSSMLPISITFEYLWAILPPDCLVVGKDSLGFDAMWCVRSHTIQQTQSGVFLTMSAEYIVWDGEMVGTVWQNLSIRMFSGLKNIRDLPYVPLRYHENPEAITKSVLELSEKAMKFWKPDFSHEDHHGTGLAQVYDKVEKYPFSGRIIIDPKMMRQIEPANIVMPAVHEISNLRESTRVWMSDLTTDDEKPKILEQLLESASATFVGDDNESDTSERSSSPMPDASRANIDDESADGSNLNLSKEQMLIASTKVFGYSLREGTWGAFSVERIKPISWNNTIFDWLVMEEGLKQVIYRLVISHSRGSSNFDDFVQGKGKGLIGLLFGPPGCGKTLTAEAIAETAKMPLYAVSSGALGHDSRQIHEHLSTILKLASHWKAVLLLDEADVFLAQRTLTDIERNAIVSIFLREIEYYQGILLLTTNQAQVIDEAFQSRIHLSLEYHSLDLEARLKIWKSFIGTARHAGAEVDVQEDEIRSLAEIPLNGRQIKNAVSIAVKIASSDDSYAITAASLRATVRLLQSTQFGDQRSSGQKERISA